MGTVHAKEVADNEKSTKLDLMSIKLGGRNKHDIFCPTITEDFHGKCISRSSLSYTPRRYFHGENVQPDNSMEEEKWSFSGSRYEKEMRTKELSDATLIRSGPEKNSKKEGVNRKARVQRVHIDGITSTKEDIIIGSVQDVFAAADFQTVILRIHEARTRLENLGCFKNVDVLIDTYEGEDAFEDGIEVTFGVKEVNFLGARVNTSVGNNEGSVTTGASLRNIFGRGEELYSDCSYGTKKTSSFTTTFRKPFHNEASTELTTSIYQQASEAPWSGFKELDRGYLLSLAFISAPSIRQKLMLDGAWRHLTCLSRSTAFAVREQSGHSLKSALKHELCLDKRDSFVFPTDGVSCTVRNELAGLGGDVGFLKNELDLQVNLPLIRDLVIQGTLQAGHMLPLHNNKTHCISDKFFLGGPTSIRGFEMAGIGPHSDGNALGAEMYWAAAIHFYSPLPLLARGGSFSEKFRLHAFVNTGNIGDFVVTDDYKKNVRTLLKDMRLSYGAGLAMNLGGFARVELNYCIPLMLQRGDRPAHGIQFGVSTSFL